MNFKKSIGTAVIKSYKEILTVLFFSILFIVGLSFENYLLSIIPFAILGSILLLINLKLGFYLTAFILPFSINIPIRFIGITLNTPLEPILFLLAISTLYHIFFKGIQLSIVKHPISILVLILCSLYLISSCFSVLPFSSLRIVIQNLGFIIPAFWGMLYCSQSDRNFPVKILTVTLIAFSILSAINFFKHAQYSFGRGYAATIPEPFYTDHTIYSAMAALMIPLAFVLMLWFAQRSLLKFFLFGSILLLCISALVLSYSRAALLSVIIAYALYVIIKYRIHWTLVFSMLLIAGGVLYSKQEEIQMSLRRNQTDSRTKKTDVEKQLKSMVNVSNDVSNLERINRWSSAFRMIEEKPYLGFGYGTYQHTYFAYQKESEMTPISIRNPQARYVSGTGGTTHSEYLLMSSENGIAAGVIFALLLVSALFFTFKNVKKQTQDSYIYYIIIGLGMSVTTYLVHSFFNNFLDTSKICFIFYAMLAALLALDLETKESVTENISLDLPNSID